MPSLNKVLLMGNLTRDPELRVTPKGTPICQFSLAINRKFKEIGMNGWVCAQIHDQLVIEVAEGNAEEAAKIVQECMENTTKLSIALKAPPAIAHNMRDGH